MSTPPSTLETEPFHFIPFNVTEVCRALKNIDTSKSAGPDKLDPFFLKIAADIIAEPLTYIFNLSLSQNSIPEVWKSAFVLPLLKGGDPSSLNNYRPISKLCVLAKVLEKLVSEQLKDFLNLNNTMAQYQSGFRKQHSTITAGTKVVNDIIEALDDKKYCAALFIDLSKAFDTVDHITLLNKLFDIGLSSQAVGWFKNYLTARTQRVHTAGFYSSSLLVSKGVLQGSTLGPLLFAIYVNDLCQDISNSMYHLYADDTVLYFASRSLTQTIDFLQFAFDVFQSHLNNLKMVLNASKSKLMVFSGGKTLSANLQKITTAQGAEIESVTSYKYLGITIDNNLSFKEHIDSLVSKCKVKLGFFFRNKSCFSAKVRDYLISTTFLPILDYGDILFMNAAEKHLKRLDSVYHCALRFITGCGYGVHHCRLYAAANRPSLSARRLSHWLLFVYKTVLGLLPDYLSTYLIRSNKSHGLRSQDFIMMSVPRVRTELGKKAFKYAAPSSWNLFQMDLRLTELITVGEFKALLPCQVPLEKEIANFNEAFYLVK